MNLTANEIKILRYISIEPRTRKQICKGCNIPWTTAFDVLESLQLKKLAGKYQVYSGTRGRQPEYHTSTVKGLRYIENIRIIEGKSL